MAAGRLPLAAGRWPMAAGRWPLAAGRWPLAAGRWPLTTHTERHAADMAKIAAKHAHHWPRSKVGSFRQLCDTFRSLRLESVVASTGAFKRTEEKKREAGVARERKMDAAGRRGRLGRKAKSGASVGELDARSAAMAQVGG